MRPAFELLRALSENNVLGTGPNGESPTPPIGFGLTNEELRKVRAMHATAATYKKAAAQGVKLVFMDNVPMGMKHGEDYVSVASADNFGNGVASAHLMAEGLDGRGSVGVVFHNADFFVTRQRYEAFRQ